MTFEEIKAELAAMIVELTERGVPSPDIHLAIKGDERPYVYFTHRGDGKHFNGRDFAFHKGETPQACIAKAWTFIRAMPSVKEAVAREYTRKLADAVDFAVDNALPDAAVTPVRDAIRVVHDVLLPAPQPAA